MKNALMEGLSYVDTDREISVYEQNNSSSSRERVQAYPLEQLPVVYLVCYQMIPLLYIKWSKLPKLNASVKRPIVTELI